MDDKKKIFVYGAGISGQGVSEVLARKGSAVILYNDDKKELDPAWLKAFEAWAGNISRERIRNRIWNSAICSSSLPASPSPRKR